MCFIMQGICSRKLLSFDTCFFKPYIAELLRCLVEYLKSALSYVACMAEQHSQLQTVWQKSFKFAIVIVAWSYVITLWNWNIRDEEFDKVKAWLQDNDFHEFVEDFDKFGK